MKKIVLSPASQFTKNLRDSFKWHFVSNQKIITDINFKKLRTTYLQLVAVKLCNFLKFHLNTSQVVEILKSQIFIIIWDSQLEQFKQMTDLSFKFWTKTKVIKILAKICENWESLQKISIQWFEWNQLTKKKQPSIRILIWFFEPFLKNFQLQPFSSQSQPKYTKIYENWTKVKSQVNSKQVYEYKKVYGLKKQWK